MNPTKKQIDVVAEHLAALDGVAFTANLLPGIRERYRERAERVAKMLAPEPIATPAREQIDAACERIDLASMWQAFDKAKTAAFNENTRYTERAKDLAGLDAVRALMAESIAAITAELDRTSRQVDDLRLGFQRATFELEAERKAHAATKHELDFYRCANEDTRAIFDKHGVKAGLLPHRARDLIVAWQSATGHASPEAFEAAKVDTAPQTDEEFAQAVGDFVKEQDEAAARNDYAYDAWVRGLRTMNATQRLFGLLATRWREGRND